MKLSREIKTAIIVVAGIVAFYIGFNFLKSKSLFPHSGGLKTGTQITVNGVKVGSVEAVDLEEKSAKIKITMECSDDFKFSKNSVAELYNSLLGGAGLQIIPAFDNAPAAVSGDVLEARVQEDMLASLSSSIKPTQDKLNHLLGQADTTLTGVNSILDAKTTNDLKNAITELSATMRNLNQASATLNKMLVANQTNLNATLTNANKITTDLSKVSGQLSEAELNKVIANAQTTLTNLNTLLADVEGGKGTIGKLLQDLRLNPKRYLHFSVFGKKAKVYEPNDEEKAE